MASMAAGRSCARCFELCGRETCLARCGGPARRRRPLIPLSTARGHDETDCSPPSARLATAEYPAVTQAPGTGRGAVSRA